MQRAISLPTSVYSSAASQLLLEAFPHLRVARPEQGATYEAIKINRAKSAHVGSLTAIRYLEAPPQGTYLEVVEVTPVSSRLELFDILNMVDIGLLILSKFLTAEHRAALACTCALGKEVTAAEFFRENLLFGDCIKLTDNVFNSLVLRATLLNENEGVALAMLNISGCKHLSWHAVRGALRDMGRLERLCMCGGPLIKVNSGAEMHALLAELGACTAAVSFSLELGINGYIQDVGDQDASQFSAILSSLSTPDPNLKIEALDLIISREIGPEGAKALASTLIMNEQDMFIGSMNTLDLYDNKIGDEGAKALAVALTPNAEGVFNGSLNTLDLCRNQIGPEGAKALAVALTPNAEGVFNTSLNTLDLYKNVIGDEGAKALAVALTPNAEGVFNTSLNTLGLGNNDIGDEGAKALAVALTPNAEGVFNTSLNTLKLYINGIGPEGAKALAAALTPNEQGVFNGSLNTLNLQWNNIGPEGAKWLAVALTPNEEGVFNTSLNTLDLRKNDIGPEGAKALAVALTPNAEGVFNTSLNTLNLKYNRIGPEGAKALAVALTPNAKGVFNGSLNKLYLSCNQLCGLNSFGEGTYDASGIKALAEALVFNKSLNTLDLEDNQLCGLSKYEGEGTYDASGIKALAEALVFIKSLNTLNLGGNMIGVEGAKALAVTLTPNEQGVFNGSLNTLDLEDNQLCGLSKYEGEGTYDASGIKALAEALVFIKSLNTLNLGGNMIGVEGAKALAVTLTPNEQGVFNG
ncbi:hypothetical protein CYMTET_15337, partial [Cymbomonas tetramitiformis]